MRTPGPLVMAVAAGLLMATPAAAYRHGSCLMGWKSNGHSHPGQPSLLGVALHAESPEEAVALANDLGLAPHVVPGEPWLVWAPVGLQALVWRNADTDPVFFGPGAPRVLPLMSGSFDFVTPLPYGVWEGPRIPDHRPRTPELLTVLGVVPDAVEARWAMMHPGCNTPLAGGWRSDYLEIGVIDAIVTPSDWRSGVATFIAPSRRDGVAARWLAESGPHWAVIALRVENFAACVRRLRGNGFEVQVELVPGMGRAFVLPGQAGGVAFEFVESPPHLP